MVKCIIYKDDQSQMFFCVNGRIFIESKGSYVDAKEVLRVTKGKTIQFLQGGKTIKFLQGLKERQKQIEKLLSLGYKEASKLHLKNQLEKGRKGKLFEGEFNYE